MNIYIWTNVENNLTDAYHDGGGVAIVATDEATSHVMLLRHMEAVRAEYFKEYPKSSHKKEIRIPPHDFEYALDGEYEPHIHIFPGEGCC